MLTQCLRVIDKGVYKNPTPYVNTFLSICAEHSLQAAEDSTTYNLLGDDRPVEMMHDEHKVGLDYFGGGKLCGGGVHTHSVLKEALKGVRSGTVPAAEDEPAKAAAAKAANQAAQAVATVAAVAAGEQVVAHEAAAAQAVDEMTAEQVEQAEQLVLAARKAEATRKGRPFVQMISRSILKRVQQEASKRSCSRAVAWARARLEGHWLALDKPPAGYIDRLGPVLPSVELLSELSEVQVGHRHAALKQAGAVAKWRNGELLLGRVQRFSPSSSSSGAGAAEASSTSAEPEEPEEPATIEELEPAATRSAAVRRGEDGEVMGEAIGEADGVEDGEAGTEAGVEAALNRCSLDSLSYDGVGGFNEHVAGELGDGRTCSIQLSIVVPEGDVLPPALTVTVLYFEAPVAAAEVLAEAEVLADAAPERPSKRAKTAKPEDRQEDKKSALQLKVTAISFSKIQRSGNTLVFDLCAQIGLIQTRCGKGETFKKPEGESSAEYNQLLMSTRLTLGFADAATLGAAESGMRASDHLDDLLPEGESSQAELGEAPAKWDPDTKKMNETRLGLMKIATLGTGGVQVVFDGMQQVFVAACSPHAKPRPTRRAQVSPRSCCATGVS